jgi:hypothetical protein
VALDAPRVVVTATEDRPAIARVGALIDGVAAHAMGRL